MTAPPSSPTGPVPAAPAATAAPAPAYAQVVGQIVDRYAEASATTSRLRLLLRESAAVVEELSLPSLHRRVVEAAHQLVALPAATLAVLDGDGAVVQLVQRDADEVVGCLPLDPAVAAGLAPGLGAAAPGHPARLAAGTLPAPWSDGGTAIAVHHRRDVLAVLLVAEPDGGLAADDEDLLLVLAASAGTALENARLYEEARRRQEWLQEAAELSSGTLAVVSEAEAVVLVARSVQKLADAELVAAWVPGGPDGALVPAATLGDRAEALGAAVLHRDDPLVADALAAGRGARRDAVDQPASAGLAALAGLDVGPVLVLPVTGGSGLTGLLVAGRHAGRPPFGDVDLDMAETFVGHVAMALELIRARAAHERVAQLEDRERIARDLHEHVASWLLATSLTVQRAAGASRELTVRRLLHEVVGDIDVTLRRLRDSIFQLGAEQPDTAPRRTGPA
ncbi:GAF domain-containing protein [Microlunatus capsulatus]|uniref:GAF domain-containing protein n=1 Tax=Microlunatus capsulatus TaxID=99117 RepID=A0ABS4Z5E5_9ACTN|nr:GAF domain-containing protein [Microlunatus capsulatus]MBP2415962.1 GAF domain-containing protein [Microlunatus capsulatus]